MKRAILFGAGLVAGPLVKYLLEDASIAVTVASRTVEKAEAVIGGHRNGNAVKFDISGDEDINELIGEHDISISLLPYAHHPKVAGASIRAGIPMVTTSYVSQKMKELDKEAREAGVIFLNEAGLDPGIDHMEAMRIIDETKERGGQILGFKSYCGGLPSPEANTNPWGYKFSWSPLGVVLAGRNDARFLKGGSEVVIPGRELFSRCEAVNIEGLGRFLGYPNRDSIPYIDLYGIEGVRDMFRGTLRNQGWCDNWQMLTNAGLLGDERPEGETYGELMDSLFPGGGARENRIAEALGIALDHVAIRNWRWLGLFSDEPLPAVSSRAEALAKILERKLVYFSGERDMIVLRHEFEVLVDGTRMEIPSTLIDFGIPGGDSSMSRTVGLPAAVCSELILNGGLNQVTGVQIPTIPEIYGPALEKLKEKGIEFRN